jgi:hypothetical protein
MHRKIHKILVKSNPQDQKNQRESVVVFLATSLMKTRVSKFAVMQCDGVNKGRLSYLGRTDPNVDGRRGEFPDYSQDK